MAARGYVSVFLTTNFDRLLERALEAAGVAPTTVSSPDALEGTVPLGRTRCTVIKLNGDYLDTRIKNTPEELDAYDPAIDRLLDRVLDEYGLIVCGWSADWDTALRRAFERCQTRRYTTFWASRNPPTGMAARIVELRGAELVQIKDADTLFTELAGKLATLDGEARRAIDGGRHEGAGATGLPARATAFVGRRAELKLIEESFKQASTRLLTLLGPGGTGKTTLAIQAAADIAPDFTDGVAFVDLSTARNTDAVLVAIVRAIRLEEVVGRPLSDVLTDHLRQRRMLLVLDNFEQVTEAASLVAQLLADCPSLSMLVTSREALHLRGEHLYPVPPLTLPSTTPLQVSARLLETCEAAQLFVDRAQAVRPDFRLIDENASAVAEICLRLDGLPLAIELAAARLRLFSLEALQTQLRDRLKLLRSGPRDLPERQQTLRATMDWSYDLLRPDEQRLFELLAVFSGADMAAIEALAAQVDLADVGDPLDTLASLIEKSLIRQVEQPHGEPRFAMLETIREFASDRLDQRSDLSARARRAHATYYAEMAYRLQADLSGSRRIAALGLMVADLENLRTAWNYWVAAKDLAQLEKLVGGLLILNEAHGWSLATVELTTGMLAVLDETISSPERVGQEIALRTSLARALMATKGFTPEVEGAYAKGIELFEAGADAHQQFSTLRGLANLYSLTGDLLHGNQIGARLLELAKQENNPVMLVEGELLVGVAKMFTNDPQGGLEHLDRAISTFPSIPLHAFSTRAGGNDPRVACYTASGITLWLLGYPDRAAERAAAAMSLAAEVGHPFTLAYAHFHSGLLHLWRRDFDTVLDLMGGMLQIAEEHGFQIWKAGGIILSGAARAGLGLEEGLVDVRNGMTLYQGLRSPPVFWPMLLSIQAAACLHAGRPAEGLQPIDAALEIMSPGDGTTLLSELQLLKGDLLLALAIQRGEDDPEPERWYRQALEHARELNIRISQLRAATRLCRVSKGEAEHATASRALAEVYATFNEGAATRDLAEARELLDSVPAS